MAANPWQAFGDTEDYDENLADNGSDRDDENLADNGSDRESFERPCFAPDPCDLPDPPADPNEAAEAGPSFLAAKLKAARASAAEADPSSLAAKLKAARLSATDSAAVAPEPASERRGDMTKEELVRFRAGEFGRYGGAGLPPGLTVPADVELLEAVHLGLKRKWRPRRVAKLGADFPGRPVVLNFGSLTAKIFVRNVVNFDRIASRYREHADFYFVYVDEAHPSDGWTLDAFGGLKNVLGDVEIPRRPTSTEERCATAYEWHEKVATDCGLLVDAIDGRANAAFEARPERLYILLEDTVVYASGEGAYNLDEMKQHLISFF